MTLFETEFPVEGRIEVIRIACATEECACGMGRALLWSVRD